MSLPVIPEDITRDDAINKILTSIAMEEISLSHILNAEGEKLQYVLGTLEGQEPPENVTIEDLLKINESIRSTLRGAAEFQMVLRDKLKETLEAPPGPEPGPDPPDPPIPPVPRDLPYLFAWSGSQQSIVGASEPNTQGGAVEFDDNRTGGDALELSAPAEIKVLEPGTYLISWKMFVVGNDVAFALFFRPEEGGLEMLPGSNYGAFSNENNVNGQAVAVIEASGTLSLNRIDSLAQTAVVQDRIAGGARVVGASVVVVKLV